MWTKNMFVAESYNVAVFWVFKKKIYYNIIHATELIFCSEYNIYTNNTNNWMWIGVSLVFIWMQAVL